MSTVLDHVADAPELAPDEQRIVIHGATWKQYVTVNDAFPDRPGLRMTYLEGVLEIMSPSRDHEGIKKCIARLLEMWAMERGVDLNGYGSTTFRKRTKERGIEPDECYCVGPLGDVPDLAIEVTLSRPGIDKLDVYRGLGVREVWRWRKGRLHVHVLRKDGYEEVERSVVLAEIDVVRLSAFVRPAAQTEAARAYRDALRAQP